MAKQTMTLNCVQVKRLAAQFGFDSTEFLIAASARPLASARTDRSFSLADLEIAEARDEASAKSLAAAAKSAKKAAAAAKKAAKEARPKRAPTGYLLYCDSIRSEVKTELEKCLDEGEKLAPTSTVRELAAQWRELSKEEKAEWKAKSAAIKESMKSGSSSDGSVSE